ncbi:MAG TPA: hypothetical protein PLO33_11315, partial [Kouleothrix sp.]|nr:hypothetical protein [Kouleothrix sp.]
MDAMIIWGVAVAAGVALWLLKTSMLDQPINANAARLARMSKAEPDAALQEQQKRLQRSSDLAGWLLLALQVLTIALLPAWPSARIYEAMQSAAFGWLVIATLILLLQLELSPFFYQSIARMRLRGLATGALTGAIALGALLIIVTLPLAEHAGVPHPVDLASVRRFLLGNMAFCGGLTLLREQRRRVRSGDMLRYGARDSLYVALQLLIVFNVAAMAIAAPLIMIVQITGLLDPRQTIAASLNLLAFIWTCVSIAYLFLYFLRRVSQARGFSWLDPPNWRVAMPHLRYNFRAYGALQVLTFAVVLAAVLALSRPGQLFGWLGGWRRGGVVHAQSTPNLTGSWAFEVSTQAGTGNATVTFKQDGEKLTGHYSGS